jgi:acid phosphatase
MKTFYFKSKLAVLGLFLLANTILSAQDQSILINLHDAVKSVKQYHTSEKFNYDVDNAIDDGLANLQQLEIPKNAAFVFDIDETALSNLEYELRYNFGYDPKTWDEWIKEANATAIPGVKRLYDSLIARGIKIIFITGRNFALIKDTELNLKKAGYNLYDTLICKTPEFKGKKAVEYKSQIRNELSNKYKIIGSVGDQWSDLEGGWTIIKIKIPNYMYFIE